MVHQRWVHDMDAGIPDLSKDALSCLVRFVRHQGTAGSKSKTATWLRWVRITFSWEKHSPEFSTGKIGSVAFL